MAERPQRGGTEPRKSVPGAQHIAGNWWVINGQAVRIPAEIPSGTQTGVTGVSGLEGGQGRDQARATVTVTGNGMRVAMTRIEGLTATGLLNVPFVFLVPPMETFTRNVEFDHVEYDTLGEGQFSQPSGRRLRTVSFSTMFVDSAYSWTLSTGSAMPAPTEMARELEQVVLSGSPFKLTASQMELWGGADWDVNMYATLRTMQVEERAGEVDARYVDVQFSEYRYYEVPRSKMPASEKALPVQITIDKDSSLTLSGLSKTYYGTTVDWRLISSHNDMSWQPNRPLGQWVETRFGGRTQTVRVPPQPGRPSSSPDFASAPTSDRVFA